MNVAVAYDHNYFDNAETASEAELKSKCIEVIESKAVDSLAAEIKRLQTANFLLKKALDLCKQQRDLWIDAIAKNAEIEDAGRRVKQSDNNAIDEIMGVENEVN